MDKDNVKTLQRRIAQHTSVLKTALFYVDGERIYTWDSRYDPTVTSGFGIEIQTGYSGLHPDVLELLAEADVRLMNDMTQQGWFRTIP